VKRASSTHLVLIPSFNPGELVFEVVRDARACWNPVWVVVDGSTDGTGERLAEWAATDPGLTVLQLPKNCGKGAAVFAGIEAARSAGFTHVLTMDSDGQHPADRITEFMRVSVANPQAMILGDPVFDASAPLIRLRGRKFCNWWTNLETLWVGIHDSLFGFRVYPIAPMIRVMRLHPWMRRFDFDVEVAIRLAWTGVMPINLPAAVRYLRPDEGGVSHFNYWRDNVLLVWMHARLMTGFILRLPVLLWRLARVGKTRDSVDNIR
jgi:glycosyltransferase involved in cell wall biosynthesis